MSIEQKNERGRFVMPWRPMIVRKVVVTGINTPDRPRKKTENEDSDVTGWYWTPTKKIKIQRVLESRPVLDNRPWLVPSQPARTLDDLRPTNERGSECQPDAAEPPAGCFEIEVVKYGWCYS